MICMWHGLNHDTFVAVSPLNILNTLNIWIYWVFHTGVTSSWKYGKLFQFFTWSMHPGRQAKVFHLFFFSQAVYHASMNTHIVLGFFPPCSCQTAGLHVTTPPSYTKPSYVAAMCIGGGCYYILMGTKCPHKVKAVRYSYLQGKLLFFLFTNLQFSF